MAKKTKSVADIDREIKALQAKRTEALEAQSAHVGNLAARAGLTELDIPDADLLKEFKAIAERFQKASTNAASAGH